VIRHETKPVSFIHSCIHLDYFYSDSSSPLLLRGAPDTARILLWGFMPNRHRQLWAKDLPKVSKCRQKWDSNPQPFGQMATYLPMSDHDPQLVRLACSRLLSVWALVTALLQYGEFFEPRRRNGKWWATDHWRTVFIFHSILHAFNSRYISRTGEPVKSFNFYLFMRKIQDLLRKKSSGRFLDMKVKLPLCQSYLPAGLIDKFISLHKSPHLFGEPVAFW